MVDQGWALAFRRYGLDYVAEERSARDGRRGIWAGSFVPPWAFRARHGARFRRKATPERDIGATAALGRSCARWPSPTP